MMAPLRRLLMPVLLVPWLWFPDTGYGDPQSAADLLARFRQTYPIEFRYTETRRLELMSEPWKGSGYLFSDPDGTLVKLQIAPERLIMAIVGDTMVYYESATRRRQSAPLSYAGPMAEQIKMFRAILQGRAAELEAGFELRPRGEGGRWALTLAGKTAVEGTAAPMRIELSGDDAGRRRHIRIHDASGDETEYAMEQSRAGSVLELPIRQLVSEATGK
jgi:hypothetical protein